MIKNPAEAEIFDVIQGTPITFRVNSDPLHPDSVKIIINGQEAVIAYTDLFSIMFTLATKEQQAKMIPVREELGNQYMKQINVKLTKDLKAGEFLVVNVPINVPEIIEAAILKEKEELSTGNVKTPYLTEDNKE